MFVFHTFPCMLTVLRQLYSSAHSESKGSEGNNTAYSLSAQSYWIAGIPPRNQKIKLKNDTGFNGRRHGFNILAFTESL
jgi:hypothetical protein